MNIGIVGLNFGRHIIDEQLSDEKIAKMFNLYAVCDSDLAKAKAVAEQTSTKAYGDIDSLLKDDNITAVGLFTGPIGRADLIDKIIDSGKHVITTKPFELDADKAAKVLDKAHSMGRIVHMNSPSPLLSEDMQVISEWREVYQLGQPIACRCETWASYRECADGSWYDDPLLCPVPPIFRLGIYLINDLVRIFGKAERVSVMQSRIFTNRPTSDNAQLGIMFENKAIANVFSSFCVGDGQYYINSLTLNFENGTIYRNVGCPETGGNESELSIVKNCKKVECRTVGSHSGTYQWKHFHDAINQRILTSTEYRNTIVDAIRIINAMSKAQTEGGVVLV